RLLDDVNGAEQEGFGRAQVTIGNGRRSSNARAYLYPVRSRKNLTVLTETLTCKVLLEGVRAQGVEVLYRNQLKVIRARREVLLASGVINTPQLLMLSGIGDPQQLASFGIPVHTSLPGVGSNLQDHV